MKANILYVLLFVTTSHIHSYIESRKRIVFATAILMKFCSTFKKFNMLVIDFFGMTDYEIC